MAYGNSLVNIYIYCTVHTNIKNENSLQYNLTSCSICEWSELCPGSGVKIVEGKLSIHKNVWYIKVFFYMYHTLLVTLPKK